MTADTRLVLVRHAESQATVDEVVGGETGCTGLSRRGRHQAAALRDRLARTGELHADVLWSSVLPRAVETAEIIAPAVGAGAPRQDCDLCELHPGECDGMPWTEYRERYGFDMSEHPDRPLSPGGESLRTFQARVAARIDRLVADHARGTVVVVCHGGVITAATLHLLGAPGVHEPRGFVLVPENTSLTEWVRTPDAGAAWVLARYNDAAHLAGSPTG